MNSDIVHHPAAFLVQSRQLFTEWDYGKGRVPLRYSGAGQQNLQDVLDMVILYHMDCFHIHPNLKQWTLLIPHEVSDGFHLFKLRGQA